MESGDATALEVNRAQLDLMTVRTELADNASAHRAALQKLLAMNANVYIEQMVADTFEERYVAVVQGNRDVNRLLLEQRYDIIFFTGTYNSGSPVSHVGIYVGNGMMIHCGNPIQYASVNSSYWSSHFYAYGRLN